MRPILFSFGRLNFYSYGFFTALGFIAAGAVIDYLAKKKKLITGKEREYFLIDALLFSLVVGVVSARMGYIILYSMVFAVEPLYLTANPLSGGFVFYSGFAAGLVAMIWWLRQSKVPILAWLDVIIVGVLVGYTFSEIGGYLNDGQIAHLAGLVGGSVLVGIMYHLVLAEKVKGKVFLLGMLSLLILSFFLGFWQPEKLSWWGLTLSQWTSLTGVGAVGSAFKYLAKK